MQIPKYNNKCYLRCSVVGLGIFAIVKPYAELPSWGVCLIYVLCLLPLILLQYKNYHLSASERRDGLSSLVIAGLIILLIYLELT